MSKRTRSDKKFPVKVWVNSTKKLIFRSHCFEYHLSMMFVGEQFLIKALTDFTDEKLKTIIKERMDEYSYIGKSTETYEVIGIRLTNTYWQKLAYFAVLYETSVAKIGSCIFDYCSEDYELRKVFGEKGIFIPNKRKRGLDRSTIEERTSDY